MMTQLHHSQQQTLEQVVIAWADATADLAQALRNLDYACAPPGLKLAPPPPVTITAIAIGVVIAVWQRVFHCACQWHLAIELHPGWVHCTGWCGAVAGSLALRGADAIRHRFS